MTSAVATLREKLKDARWYMEHLLKIRTKDQRLIRLKLNVPQLKLHNSIEKQIAEGKPIRLIVLKGRQEGVSTYTEARGFHMSATRRYTSGLVIAHDTDGSDNLFAMSKRYYEHLPEEIDLGDGQVVQIKPRPKYSNRKELVFEDLDSRITIDTANNKDAGRSATIQWFHGSEVAFWTDAKATMLSVMQAVPKEPGTMVILESTANGVGGYFYDEWFRAKRGESDFVPVFIAWWEMPSYRAPVTEPLDLDEEERYLKEAYGLDDEQLQWRRDTIRTECQGDVDLFRQEYPSNDIEAFLVSGRPFFDVKALRKASQHTRSGDKGFLDERDGKILWVPDAHGWLTVFAHPQSGRKYAVGGDVAEGLEKGDFSCGQVIDRETFEQVAIWHGHIDPDLLGSELRRLAQWYNQAWLGVEVNNHGLTTNKTIARLGYNRLLHRQNTMEEEDREIEPTDRLGWRTDVRTRPVMLDDLARAIREGTIKLNDAETVQECLTFVRNEKGKPEAQEGCHDDRVMALAIALQVHQLTPLHGPKGKAWKPQPLNRRTGY